MNWYDDLCEYFSVTPEKAIELSERKPGRKPDLPAGRICKAVSGKTWEELWSEKDRSTIKSKLTFYYDIGSWQVFRQCNYRKDFNYDYLIARFFDVNSKVVEYGCGVAPMTNHYVENINKYGDKNIEFTLVDVPGEHLEFAKWRILKKKSDIKLNIVHVTEDNLIPSLGDNVSLVCLMDVLEHVPNPLDILKNIMSSLTDSGILIETWVDGKPGFADLSEAFEQRDECMRYLNSNMITIDDHKFLRIRRNTSDHQNDIPCDVKNEVSYIDEWTD